MILKMGWYKHNDIMKIINIININAFRWLSILDGIYTYVSKNYTMFSDVFQFFFHTSSLW